MLALLLFWLLFSGQVDLLIAGVLRRFDEVFGSC